jgi:hypothetical protein
MSYLWGRYQSEDGLIIEEFVIIDTVSTLHTRDQQPISRIAKTGLVRVAGVAVAFVGCLGTSDGPNGLSE